MLQKSPISAKLFQQMVDNMPVAVMICDLRDFRVTYMNETSRATLTQIEHLLPIKVSEMIGTSIDVFHKDPSHQRQLLSNPANLPHNTHIKLGDETLDLLVTPIMDGDKYIAPMLTWSIITDKVKSEEMANRQAQMLDQMPINVMYLEPENFTITYANKTSLDTLRGLQNLLPCQVDDLVGQCVDIFHKNPAHQRGILSDPSNLPYQANIRLGDEHLDLLASPVHSPDGKYIGAMLTWSIITQRIKLADDFESNIGTVVGTVSSSSAELQSTAESMATTSEETTNQASAVAAAAEELSSSVQEISRQVGRSASIATEAVSAADRSNTMVQGLSEAANKIGDVVNLINDIASQTNLLALNATIEAARAGEAGKGFAVVASEVKNLANQTAKATEEISAQIGDIQTATKDTVDAIEGIGATIREISEISTTISSAVEEQNASTQEVARNIQGVTEASNKAGKAAGQVLDAASELSTQSDALGGQVQNFMVDIRGGDKKNETESAQTPPPPSSTPPEFEAPAPEAPAPEISVSEPEVEVEVSSGPFSTRQIQMVQDTFAMIEPIADQAADLFYSRLFELDPSIKALFTSDMKEQGRKLMSTLKIVVSSLDKIDQLIPVAEKLGKDHVGYGVQAEHYDTVGEALLWALEHGLDTAYTPEVEDAWTAVYTTLAATMKHAAGQ